MYMINPKSKPHFTLEVNGVNVPVWVWDNEGRTFDRFTAVVLGDVVGMSEKPQHPQGFGQHCGQYGDRELGGDGLKYHRGWGKVCQKESLPPGVIKYLQHLAS